MQRGLYKNKRDSHHFLNMYKQYIDHELVHHGPLTAMALRARGKAFKYRVNTPPETYVYIAPLELLNWKKVKYDD